MKIYLLGASISVIKIKYIVVKNITFQCLFKIPFMYGLSIYKLVKKFFMVFRMLLYILGIIHFTKKNYLPNNHNNLYCKNQLPLSKKV